MSRASSPRRARLQIIALLFSFTQLRDTELLNLVVLQMLRRALARPAATLLGRSARVAGPPALVVASMAIRRPAALLPPRAPLCTHAKAPSEQLAEELSELYAEARELMSDAEEGRDTVYFEEDLEDAREAIGELLERYAAAKTELPAREAEQLTQLVGLKVEELKARLDVLLETLIHDDD